MSLFKKMTLGLLFCAMPMLVACLGSGGGGNSYGNHDFGDNDKTVAVALGDSITQGYSCEGETEAFPSRIAGMTGMTVINAGRGGEQSSGAASRAGGLMDRYKPGFILIFTGHNDAIFDRNINGVLGNIRAIIQAAKNRKVVPIVATLVPIGPPRVFATRPARDYSEGIRALAKEMDVALVDIEKEMGDNSDLFCDGLHPVDAGSIIIAAAFADKLP